MKLIHKVLCVDDHMESMTPTMRVIDRKNKMAGIETRFCCIDVQKQRHENQNQFRSRMRKELRTGHKAHEFFNLSLIDLYM